MENRFIESQQDVSTMDAEHISFNSRVDDRTKIKKFLMLFGVATIAFVMGLLFILFGSQSKDIAGSDTLKNSVVQSDSRSKVAAHNLSFLNSKTSVDPGICKFAGGTLSSENPSVYCITSTGKKILLNPQPSPLPMSWALTYKSGDGESKIEILKNNKRPEERYALWKNNLIFQEVESSNESSNPYSIQSFDLEKKTKRKILESSLPIESILFSNSGFFVTFTKSMGQDGGEVEYIEFPSLTHAESFSFSRKFGAPSIAAVTENVTLADCNGGNGSWNCSYYKLDMTPPPYIRHTV